MRGSVGLGLGIAVLFAGGVLLVSVFGKHEDWFLRAARQNAVRCLTKEPCPMLDAKGAITMAARPPLSAASPCAKPQNWIDAKAAAGGKPVFIVICRDGAKAYLYHLGKLRFGSAGQEQWMICSEPECDGEINDVTKLMVP